MGVWASWVHYSALGSLFGVRPECSSSLRKGYITMLSVPAIVLILCLQPTKCSFDLQMLPTTDPPHTQRVQIHHTHKEYQYTTHTAVSISIQIQNGVTVVHEGILR